MATNALEENNFCKFIDAKFYRYRTSCLREKIQIYCSNSKESSADEILFTLCEARHEILQTEFGAKKYLLPLAITSAVKSFTLITGN
jgi:hypothetical protein